MTHKAQPAKRKRGILLGKKGWQRLQSAELRYVNQYNDGKLLTLQDLSDRTGLSANTLARVRGRKIAVDQQTLEGCDLNSIQLKGDGKTILVELIPELIPASRR